VTTLRILGGKPLTGTAPVPADLDVLQCALALAAIADGPSQLMASDRNSNLAALASALRALGVPVAWSDAGLAVQGVGLRGLRMPAGALDAGRSFTSLALITGLLSAQPFGTRVTCHPSLAARSVENLVGPLRARGAHVAGHVTGQHAHPTPPVSVAPLLEDERLHALDCALPRPDASAKASLLINALYASGTTTLSEPLVSPDHMERLWVALGLPLRRIGAVVHVDPSGWTPRVPPLGEFHAPGCVTCAAFASAAALLVPGSRIALGGVGGNPSRAAFFDVLRLWNAPVQVLPRGDTALREPTQDVLIRHGSLRGGVLGGELLVRARTELPALAMLGCVTTRETQLHDLQAVAPEEDPTASALEAVLGTFGVDVHRSEGALCVRGGRTLRGARVNVADQAELAMAALVLGLTAEGETVIEQGAEALAFAHPGFLQMLRGLGARIETS
jgi:3-phosphoshikimate 1-carboxyvinyltransferase